jgi:ubiquinone/menaquinone biosynthesis C-methylase UbiE
MNTDYNHTIASHYAAYRPPLHKIILKKVLSGDKSFSTGLDIGCGTGYSTLALATYCSNVIGIDPSQAMLDRAIKHFKISYSKGSGEGIPLQDSSVDIVTLAGSLFYVNLEKTVSEINRVCKQGALVIPYDFRILLDDILKTLSIHVEENNLEYDYDLNFSGQKGFEEVIVKQEQISLELLGDQLAHMLLSEHHLYKRFVKKYSTKRPFENLKNELVKAGNHFFINADVYYSVYHASN